MSFWFHQTTLIGSDNINTKLQKGEFHLEYSHSYETYFVNFKQPLNKSFYNSRT